MDLPATAGAPKEGDDFAEIAASLDHALLESLFYNEMALMDDNASFLPPHLFSSASTSSSDPHSFSRRESANSDPGTIAEKALLRDFGVNSLPVTSHAQWESSASASAQEVLPQQFFPGQGTNALPTQPLVSQLATQASASFQANPAAAAAAAAITNGVPNPLHHTASAFAAASAQTFAPEEKRKKLVSQFATLASRLGITLPPQVVQVLQTTAGSEMGNEAKTAPVSAQTVMVPPPTTSYSAQHPGSRVFPPPVMYPVHHQPAPPAPLPPIKAAPSVQQLQNTAEAAIAAVTEKRKRTLEEAGAASSRDGGTGTLAHSKRRKKPRLADCESRLAQLKSENDVLKRHLHNISNQSHKFDQERAEAEARMKYLLQREAGHEEMDSAIKNYTELYSDYGRRRHQELTFHLEQLQRLANPTSFTKMGLWSLQNSHMGPKGNPVAGILQKELAITAQQGRKILEQRQKIRDVCANLKECFALIGKLKALCEQKTQIFHDRMSKCREILSPKQVVQLLIWIDGHCHLIAKVCPGWGSERIQSKAQQKKKS
jgi:hypothetical protein